MELFYHFCLGAEGGGRGNRIAILLELSYSIFMKTSVSNTLGLRIKSFDYIINIKRFTICHCSSVARRGGGIAPSYSPIGLSAKMQNKKNTTFLALLKQSFALERTQNNSKHHLKHVFGRGGLIYPK